MSNHSGSTRAFSSFASQFVFSKAFLPALLLLAVTIGGCDGTTLVGFGDPNPPKVDITRPQPHSDGSALQRSFLFLKADASTSGGDVIKTYKWKVTAPTSAGGNYKTVTYKGNDLSKGHLWSDLGFYPGTFKIKVTVTENTGRTASDSTKVRIIPEG